MHGIRVSGLVWGSGFMAPGYYSDSRVGVPFRAEGLGFGDVWGCLGSVGVSNPCLGDGRREPARQNGV